jgi:hypothetical protein
MVNCRSGYRFVVILCVMVCLPLTTTSATDASMLKKQLLETIAKVKSGKTANHRAAAAQHLSELTDGTDPAKIDDLTLKKIVSLLHSSDDEVRFWVAASLGQLGPRARAIAAPALLALLPKADCLVGSLTSASAIRLALDRMGVTPPPPPTCDSSPETLGDIGDRRDVSR